MLIISTISRYISYLSNCWYGKTHDYCMLKGEFPADKDWFNEKQLRVDLGFIGIDSDYRCKEVIIPRKKPRNQELSASAKEANKQCARERIYVEHSIGGLKRYRILSDRLRLRNINFYNEVLEVCAGLWNYCLTN